MKGRGVMGYMLHSGMSISEYIYCFIESLFHKKGLLHRKVIPKDQMFSTKNAF